MKKYGVLLSVFLAIVLLSGCISIPLTDGGSIEISGDGVSIIPAVDAAEASNDNDGETKSEKKENAKTKTSEKNGSASGESESTGTEEDNETEVQDEGATDEEEDEGEVFSETEGFGGCANEFYLTVNRLPKEFPIPPCAFVSFLEILEDGDSDERVVVVHYENYGELNENHDTYKSFFESNGYSISHDSLTEELSELTVDGNGVEMAITNHKVGADELATEIYYSETPIKKYKVVDSIINMTENGHGKCSDEYYTALSVVSTDFPIPECSNINYLQIANFDSSTNSVSTYVTDSYWTEEYDTYVQYAEANNFTITHDEGLATQGQLNFEDGEFIVSVSVEKVSMSKTEVQVNVTRSF